MALIRYYFFDISCAKQAYTDILNLPGFYIRGDVIELGKISFIYTYN